jgi:hypothetical protein
MHLIVDSSEGRNGSSAKLRQLLQYLSFMLSDRAVNIKPKLLKI